MPCGGNELCCHNGCVSTCVAGIRAEEALKDLTQSTMAIEENPSGATREVSLFLSHDDQLLSVALKSVDHLLADYIPMRSLPYFLLKIIDIAASPDALVYPAAMSHGSCGTELMWDKRDSRNVNADSIYVIPSIS
ncbi:hypothetical protein FOZ63_009764 [Perkinsus olseni]|uniref:Uncharacterized protein n=1 Tax=Perkinsus olseni TaxID=32597 RepID=A0A7J6QSA6_PEROL|nr:hypothetical protein FOZ63_009764 [Perkinsus olseni]